VNLNFAVVNKKFFNTGYRSPERRFDRMIWGAPETSVGEIFRFDNVREELILTCGNLPGDIKDETFVDSEKISDAQAAFLLRPAYIFPRPEVKS
jgi:hypothetical protein